MYISLSLSLKVLLLLHLLAIHACTCSVINIQPDGDCETHSLHDCQSIDDALSMLESNDILSLAPGMYTLQNFSTDVLRGISNVTITGDMDNPDRVIINCSEGVGLFFFNVSDLTISGLTVEHCGLRGVDTIHEIMRTTKEMIHLLYNPLPDFSTAIFMAHCPNVLMSNMIIRENRGFGLVGINIVGNVTFHSMHVLANYPSECVINLRNHSQVGGSGGGMFILYQDYSNSAAANRSGRNRDSRDNRTRQSIFDNPMLGTVFRFTDSNITDNYVCRLDLFNVLHDKLSRSVRNPLPLNLSMIGAGGITFSLAQSTYQVEAHFESCLFQNNSGTYNGAAMHISQFEITNNSHIFIEGSTFKDNGEELIKQYGVEGIGPAGALLLWYYTPNPSNFNNLLVAAKLLAQQTSTVTVSNSLFTRNTARSGGGVCVISFGPEISLIQDLLLLNNTVFTDNKADFGGAIYISELSYSAFESGLNVHMKDIDVVSNVKRDMSAGNSLQAESGIIDVNFINISLSGNNYIAHNEDTALSLYGAIASISGNTVFEYNTGSTGGAMDLASESYLVLSDHTNISFFHNVALIAGGAIHVNFNFARFNNYDCFIFFENIDFFCDQSQQRCEPKDVHTYFINNSSPLGSAIYGSTFTNCPWAGGTFETSGEIQPNLSFSLDRFEPHLTIRPRLTESYPNIINTLPRSIHPKADKVPHFTIMPGKQFMILLGAFDQLNQAVPVTIFSKLTLIEGNETPDAEASIGATNRYLIDSATDYTVVPIRVFGVENSTYNLSITSNEAQVEFNFVVRLEKCIRGFVYNPFTLTCECEVSKFIQNIACENNGSISIPNGPWIGYIQDHGYVQTKCISNYCNLNVTQFHFDDPDKQCRSDRSGILCGKCREGYSRVLGSNNCRLCTNGYLALIIVFALLGILLVVVIALLNMTITDGYINGFIFYSNIMSLYLDSSLPLPELLNNSAIKFIIGFINLDFGFETCFYDGMTDIHLAALTFLFPLYLGAILLVITMISKYVQSKHLAKLLNKVNITHIFATLMLLTYSSIVRTSIDILSYTEIYPNNITLTMWRIDPNIVYFTGFHIFLFFVALFFIIILLPFPVLLVFPPCISLRIPYIKRLKPLMDAFFAPLADGKLFWVGSRLVSRNFFFMLTLLDDEPRVITLCIFIILMTVFEAYIKPFKTTLQNLIDLSIMVNLTVISFLVVVFKIDAERELVASHIVFVLILLFNLGTFLILVYYILVALPCTEKLKKKVIDKWKAKNTEPQTPENEHTAHTLSRSTFLRSRKTKVAKDMTHSSVRLPIPEIEGDRDFRPASFIGYRESLFEGSVMQCNQLTTVSS